MPAAESSSVRPPTRITPVAGRSPASASSSVVLPEPDGPARPSTCTSASSRTSSVNSPWPTRRSKVSANHGRPFRSVALAAARTPKAMAIETSITMVASDSRPASVRL